VWLVKFHSTTGNGNQSPVSFLGLLQELRELFNIGTGMEVEGALSREVALKKKRVAAALEELELVYVTLVLEKKNRLLSSHKSSSVGDKELSSKDLKKAVSEIVQSVERRLVLDVFAVPASGAEEYTGLTMKVEVGWLDRDSYSTSGGEKVNAVSTVDVVAMGGACRIAVEDADVGGTAEAILAGDELATPGA